MDTPEQVTGTQAAQVTDPQATNPQAVSSQIGNDPLWYKDALIYQIHVRSFFDANNDGYGDFNGLREKLPYLEALGVNTLWLLPFYESPLRDDGYDIADYWTILPVHGALDDFKAFLDEAHARGMRVITEMVLNHTSDRHAWFQESREPGSEKRDWYVWSDTADKYRDVRIIFTDTEHSNWTWDPVAGAYYWHRFFSHQPDLNWDNPEVEAALHEVLFYWLDMGVDGLRLDAVPYLYEREGTSGENLPETLDAIKRLRKAIEDRYGPGRILLAEANQWPEDTLPYFGDPKGGDGVQMAFNFPLMPRMYLALRRENRQPIVEMLRLTEDIPEDAQWALFLRNHDELTLEMVTDEERDFMYNEYAVDRQFRLNLGIRRRLAPLLGGERRRIELMNALVLSLKGSPVVYYGDEIGMGDNTFLGDRNGVRTPMQWSPDRNGGFSRAPHHQLFLPPVNEGPYSYQFVNVEDAQRGAHSLYGFMQRIIRLRNQHAKTFGRGNLTVLHVENERVLAFTREYEGETLLIVANLSRFAQAATLPLHAYAGAVPTELFSQAPFPPIPESGDYPIMLSPHNFYWFVLRDAVSEPEAEEADALPERKLPTIKLTGGLETMLVDTMVQGDARAQLERALPEYLKIQRWFGSKTRTVRQTRLVDAVRLQAEPQSYLALVRVEFEGGGVERYFLPLAYKRGDAATELRTAYPRAAVAWLGGPSGRLLLHDATADPDFWLSLYRAAERNWRGRSLQGLYSAAPTPGTRLPAVSEAEVMGVEQSNSSASFGGLVFGKLYRKLEDASNPEVEMLSYLTQAGFPFVPPLQGSLSFRRGEPALTLGILQSFIPGGSDAWTYALEETGRYLGRTAEAAVPEDALPEHFNDPLPAWLEESASENLQLAGLLGVRTAELHTVLAQADTPALRPEPTTSEDLEGFVERVRREAETTLEQLEAQGHPFDRSTLEHGLERLERLAETSPDWQKIRVHGDYHLGQIIRAEGELYILDFEGEPARPLSERRERDGALRDVAGMLRSLEYAGLVAWQQYVQESGNDDETWADLLIRWSEAAFLEAYLSTVGDAASFLPGDAETRDLVIWAYQLDKVLYEVRYELGSRPDWVWLPLRGLERLLS
ncbi:MAG: GH13_16 / GH13_36 / GH13_23 / GH13_17 / GH13 _4 / GH13_31 / GH13 / GH13_40 / GH13_30 / GH13_29 / G H13_35 / GH13_20 / GH13_2 / GH13_21 / GH13_18 / GH13 _34 / GH13_1 [uncultured Truepera sp.]|uniref:Maltokinase n=1 Tax=uncultured Truepera sp. TaxID=543023 RepID=A0A6J4VST1_9DEIN|nr:MAG: GH13_16 / GH13_36 / GH13_23 / GH13_17 / GH13 _4 / GH13_31 / GH13 / GH13_40 / GH13_30 / GH13_29 / G H13_35 / GH13_20 / GH13_2 / GH13_21 / GH13_18 / GH13 _34 / GH13_1 [uncultured Truepera sp.]